MRAFHEIHAIAARRKGGDAALKDLLQDSLSPAEIEAIPDDRFLSHLTKGIFQAGFSWKVVDNKWDRFEELFKGFDLRSCAMMFDETLDQIMKEKGIIANFGKMKTIRDNAQYFLTLVEQDGSLGKHFAGWQPENWADNVQAFRKGGSRAGGNTGLIFLRRVGVESLVFSNDVVAALIREGVVSKSPSSKKDFTALQEALNTWRRESGYTLTQISQILAFSVGD